MKRRDKCWWWWRGRWRRRWPRALVPLAAGWSILWALPILGGPGGFPLIVDPGPPLRSLPPPLDELTAETRGDGTCPEGLAFRSNVVATEERGRDRWRVPRIVHQTARTRCLAPEVFAVTDAWTESSFSASRGWSYYFHDDDAVMRLLAAPRPPNSPEFLAMAGRVAEACLKPHSSGAALADLWRYVALWHYGGVYADVDAAPHLLDDLADDLLGPGVDALFVVEQYHLLSQYFIAISPRHPIMAGAVRHAVANLLREDDAGKFDAAWTTGPHAMHAAYVDFRADAGETVEAWKRGAKPVRNGTYVGTNNRTVTVVGEARNENEYVWRSRLRQRIKMRAWEKMGIEHFSNFNKEEKAASTSCLSAISRLGIDVAGSKR